MRTLLAFVLFFATSAWVSAAPDPAAGKAKFQTLCGSCHGSAGKGDGPAAVGLNPKPRNLADKAYIAQKTDANLKKVIQQGGAAVGLSPAMPPWQSMLSEQEVLNIIAFIRTLK